MTEKGVPKPLADLRVKLRFLALIPKEAKVNLTDWTFERPSILSGARRLWHGEKREQLIPFIESTLLETDEMLHTYSETPDFVNFILCDLKDVKQGIYNLKTTYKDDPRMLANIDVFVDGIEYRIKQYSHE